MLRWTCFTTQQTRVRPASGCTSTATVRSVSACTLTCKYYAYQLPSLPQPQLPRSPSSPHIQVDCFETSLPL